MTAPESTQQIIDHRSPLRSVAGLVGALMRIRYVMAVLGIAVLLVCYPVSIGLQLDRSITAMFDPADPTRTDYEGLQRHFGGNAISILVYTDQALFSSAGFERSKQISERVAEVAGVKGVLSPARLSGAVEKLRPAGLFTGYSRDTPGLMRRKDLVARLLDRDFAGYTHSADHSRGAVAVMLEADFSVDTIENLQRIAADLPTDYPDAIGETALVGEPVLVHDAFALIERDGAKLATYTIGLLSVVLLISLFDFRLVILTALMIAWSVTVTKATMVWLGISLSLVSTILTSIVTVIAVATVLHIGVRFRISRSRGHSQLAAATRSLTGLMLPILWTCATDAAGFAALTWSRILPVRDFGLMIAIAATCVLVATVLFAPAALMLPGVNFGTALTRYQQSAARGLRKVCLRLARWMVGHRSVSVAVTLIIALLAVFGVARTEVETSFLNNFRSDSEIVMAYQQVEEKFGGAGVWDIVLDAPTVLTEEFLDQVLALETELREIDIDGARVAKVLSMADADQAVQRAPLLKLAPPEVRIRGMRSTIPVFVDALLTPKNGDDDQQRRFRIMLRSREHLGAEQKTKLIAAVEDVVRRRTSDPAWQQHSVSTEPGTVTGYYVMMARLVSQLVADQWRCLLASAILVWLLLLMATQSIRLAVAALLPNLLPVFLVLALVGFLGGKINMGATMIAAVSVGLSIDGSVHFLACYRRCRRRGHTAAAAATHAAGNIGVPVLLATVALVFGFSVLVSSEFIPTATFGMLVAATLAAGTVINLTLLPAFVSWIDRR